MYWGCATCANKTRWIVFAVLLAIAIVLGIGWGISILAVRDSLEDCYKSRGCFKSGDTWYCFDLDATVSYCDKKSRGDFVAFWILLVGWILCLIGASIPLYVMCCCAKNPTKAYVMQIELQHKPEEKLYDNPEEKQTTQAYVNQTKLVTDYCPLKHIVNGDKNIIPHHPYVVQMELQDKSEEKLYDQPLLETCKEKV